MMRLRPLTIMPTEASNQGVQTGRSMTVPSSRGSVVTATDAVDARVPGAYASARAIGRDGAVAGGLAAGGVDDGVLGFSSSPVSPAAGPLAARRTDAPISLASRC